MRRDGFFAVFAGVVERSRYAAERRSRLVRLGRLLYPMSHDSAQFSPSFSLAKEADIEYNPHVFWRGLRGFFSLPPRSGFVQPWNANNPPLRSGLSTFLFLLEVLRGGYGGTRARLAG